MSCTIMTDMFLPLSAGMYSHFLSWTIMAYMIDFGYQEVRIYISWVAQSWLIYSCHFLLSVGAYSHLVNWTGPSGLTCSYHSWLSGSAYLYLKSSTWLTCSRHFRISESAYLYFMSSSQANLFLLPLTLSGCVFSFRELQHKHGWHVTAIFDY